MAAPLGIVNPQQNVSQPVKIPGHLGKHYVENISDPVKKIQHQLTSFSNKWDRADKVEKGLYAVAAICLILVIVLFAIIASVLGTGALLTFFTPLASITMFGAACYYLARGYSEPHQEWAMPPFSDEVKGNKAQEKKWKDLWTSRNQAKRSFENVVSNIESKKKVGLEVDHEEAYARKLLKEYEIAEVNFWKFADEEIAEEKIEQFNRERTIRQENEVLN